MLQGALRVGTYRGKNPGRSQQTIAARTHRLSCVPSLFVLSGMPNLSVAVKPNATYDAFRITSPSRFSWRGRFSRNDDQERSFRGNGHFAGVRPIFPLARFSS